MNFLVLPVLLLECAKYFGHLPYRSGMSSAAKVIVGAPFISSASNLQFWLALCDSYSLPEAQLLVRQFQQEEEKGPQEFKQFCRKWNEDLVDKVSLFPFKLVLSFQACIVACTAPWCFVRFGPIC